MVMQYVPDLSEHYNLRLLTLGIKTPASTGTQQLTIKMPAGTTCTGGKSKNLCLMSLTTDGGFGNCVVAQQGGTAAGKSSTVATGVAASGAAAGNATTADISSCPSDKKGKKNDAVKNDRRAVVCLSTSVTSICPLCSLYFLPPQGSRAARAYLDTILLAEMD